MGSCPKIKLAQVGYGNWGAKLLPYFARHPGFKVTDVVVRNINRHPAGVEGAGFTDSLDPVLGRRGVDAVVVATPPESHYEIARNVLESGRHLFIEKTFTETAVEADSLRTLAADSGLGILVDFTFTFSAAIAQMRDLVESGVIGEMQSVHLFMRQFGEFIDESVYTLLGSHMLAVLDMLVPLDRLDFSRRDAIVCGASPETGRILFSRGDKPFRGAVDVSVNYEGKQRRIQVRGERGVIIYDMMSRPHLSVIFPHASDESSGLFYYTYDERQNLARAVQRFYDVISGTAPSNADSAVRVTEALEQIGKL